MSNKHKKNKKTDEVDISKLKGKQRQDAELRQYRKDLKESGAAVRPSFLDEPRPPIKWNRTAAPFMIGLAKESMNEQIRLRRR